METFQPKLRFPEFDGNWEVKNIGDVTNVTAGGTPSTVISEYWNGSIRWMNSGDLNLKRVFEVKNRITELGLKKSSTKFIPKNSILIGLAGQGKTRGTVAMNMVELCINQSIGAIYPNNDFFNSDFLYHNLDNRYDELRSLSTGDGGRGGLNLSIIKDLVVNLPSLEEQTKIANFLSAVDEKLNLLKEKKILLEDYKKGIMQKIFNQDIRFKNDNGYDFEDWEEKSLGEVTSITIGEFVIKTRQNPNGEYPVYNGGKTCTGYYDEFNNDGNKIVISARGANAGFVNFEKGKFWAGNSCYSVGILDKYHFEIIYFYYYVKFNENTFTENQQAANIPSVSKKDVEKFNIKIPSLKEQIKIANFLSAIDKKIELVSNQIQDTHEYKKGLLQQMFV